MRKRLIDADMSLFDEGETVCCYARSDKSWVSDPAKAQGSDDEINAAFDEAFNMLRNRVETELV